MYYILDGKTVVPTTDIKKWGEWFQENYNNRHVADTKKDNIRVSTVFLGVDHSLGYGPLQVFETMVFGGEHDGDMNRYSTWEEAEKGHNTVCIQVWGDYSDNSL